MSCPFCEISLKRTVILEEGRSFRIIFSNPALLKFRLLVIPKRHVEKLTELTFLERNELFEAAVKWQEKLRKKFGGCDIRQNCRPFQNEDKLKINRLHIHLQPRTFEDELYKKCQVFEKQIFRDLDLKQIKKMREEL